MNLKKLLKDKIVYWEKTGTDGYNQPTFSEAVEIIGRWEDRTEVFLSREGTELTSIAIIHVNQDLVTDSFLYLGELTDLTTAQKANPALVETSYPIKAFRKKGSLTNKWFLRKAYLYGKSQLDYGS